MSDFSIRYRAAISPIETITLEDGSTEKRFVHSNLDTVYGSTKEKDLGSTSTNVGTATYSLVFNSDKTLDYITGLTLTNVSFLYVKNTGLGIVDIYLSATRASRLKGKDDFVILKPLNADGDNVSFQIPESSSHNTSFRVVYGLFDESAGGGGGS